MGGGVSPISHTEDLASSAPGSNRLSTPNDINVLHPQAKLAKILHPTKKWEKTNKTSFQDTEKSIGLVAFANGNNNRDKKNTAFKGNTGQFSSDASSDGHVRSAHRSPADTPGVSFDSAKVRNITQKAKNYIKNYYCPLQFAISLKAMSNCS